MMNLLILGALGVGAIVLVNVGVTALVYAVIEVVYFACQDKSL
jgi:hypothetical protein